MLPFQYEREKKESGLTAFGGIGLYLDLLKATKVRRMLDGQIGRSQGRQGYRDSDIGEALLLLNLVGGECIEDIDRLEGDEGLKTIYRQGNRRSTRWGERFRRGEKRTFPSPSALFRYLERFADGDNGSKGEAAIPESIKRMRAFMGVNERLLSVMERSQPQRRATLDQDATLVATDKRDALYGYKGYKAYQPLNVYWHEHSMMLHTEFRPGNVPAGHDLLRVLREGMSILPAGVKEVYYRADGASYRHELLAYLDAERGGDEIKRRFGRIGFCVSAPVTMEFKQAVQEDRGLVWLPLDTDASGNLQPGGREWAEVCFVPNELCQSKRGREYRYLVTRQILQERALPGLEECVKPPFPVLEMERKKYKVFTKVTNLKWEGGKIIRWHDERCGRSEEAHAILKHDLAGGRFPSGKFGANAAWWWYAVLAFNLQSIMSHAVLGGAWRHKRMKAIRLHLIHLPGRIISRSNRLIVRLAMVEDKFAWLLEIRQRILALSRGPCLT
jgi:hypothetical protein